MPEFNASPRLVRVQICVDSTLDRDAYAARVSLEPGFTVVHSASLATPPDIRLATRCRMDLGEPEVVTVVLVPAPTSPRPCECCPAVPRTSSWSALSLAMRKAAGCESKLAGSGILSILTRRELDVLRLVGLGKTVNQCAETLGVAPSTVGNHKYRLMRKLGVKTSLQLLRIAVSNGLADLDDPYAKDHLGGEYLDR